MVPGNVYGVQPGRWGPDTPQIPCSRTGQIRRNMEERYRESGEKVLILRGGDFLDEASGGTIMNMVVLKGIAKGKLTLAGGLEVPRAYAYLPDMARAAVGLADLGEFCRALPICPMRG